MAANTEKHQILTREIIPTATTRKGELRLRLKERQFAYRGAGAREEGSMMVGCLWGSHSYGN